MPTLALQPLGGNRTNVAAGRFLEILCKGVRAAAVASCLALLALCCVSAPALAGETRAPEPFSPLVEPEAITDPNGIAIDEGSGNVFVNDAGSHTETLNGDASVTGAPNGLVAPYLLTSGCAFGTGSNGNGVVVDNSATSAAKGTVYVVCTNGKIRRFTRNVVTENYEAGAEISYPGSASGAGAAVDAAGNLFVSNFNPPAVYKFNSAGTLLETLALTTGTRPAAIAVDSAGNLFFRRAANPQIYRCPANGLGEISAALCSEVLNLTGATGIAINRATGKLFVALTTRVAQYDLNSMNKDFEFGVGVLGETRGLIADATNDRVYVSDTGTGKDNIAVFGVPIELPTATTKAAAEVTGTTAALRGTINPKGNAITECKFEYGLTTTYGQTVPCDGSVPTDSNDHDVTAKISGLVPNGTTYHYRLWVNSANGEATPQGSDRILVTGTTVSTEAATAITASSATLHGSVRPEGKQLTECKFEYGLTTDYGQSTSCVPAAASVPDDFGTHAVSAVLNGLQENSTYHFRIATADADGAATGDDFTFTTRGVPQIVEQVAMDATQTTITLLAVVNPSGSPTTYHFEWGKDTSYGNRVPVDHELFAGSGAEPITFTANLSGLQPQGDYYFRIVATNAHGRSVGPDQPFGTLNECGLPDDRCWELVSPRNKGPVAAVEPGSGGVELQSQAALAGSVVAYEMAGGLPDTTTGPEVVYLGTRNGAGWNSTQLSPAPLIRSQTGRDDAHDVAVPSLTQMMSDDLGCGVLVSGMPLTPDTPAQTVAEGGANLFRRDNKSGAYTLITKHAPVNGAIANPLPLTNEEYEVLGMSQDCQDVVFASSYQFPGVSGTGSRRIYQWSGGSLRNVGVIPGPGETEINAPAIPGAGPNNNWRVVSADASRVIFSAPRAVSANPTEVGKTAVFVRENNAVTHDVSLSETSTAGTGAVYQDATRDGSKVYFTSNAGLTESSSSGGVDLYEYDLVADDLRNLSIDPDAGGAAVGAVLATSDDGKYVYFAARGQLVPGEGRTFEENSNDNTYSVYVNHNGDVQYVGAIRAFDITSGPGSARAAVGEETTSRVSADGRQFMFSTPTDVTGYQSGGAVETYLYSAVSGRTVCVTCSRGGESVTPSDVLPTELSRFTYWSHRQTTMTPDGKKIFFISYDRLASGAVAGQRNLYEWSSGQIYLIASVPVSDRLAFRDASASGNDLYVVTTAKLNDEDVDGRADMYDARVNGGLPLQPPPTVKCDPLTEGACAPSVAPPVLTPSIGSVTRAGAGNEVQKQQTKKSKKKKKKKKKHKQRRGGKKRGAHSQAGVWK